MRVGLEIGAGLVWGSRKGWSSVQMLHADTYQEDPLYHCKMYLSELPNVFVWIAKCICQKCIMLLSELHNVFVWITKCICPNCKMYLSKLQNAFVRIAQCICPNAARHADTYQDDPLLFSSSQSQFGAAYKTRSLGAPQAPTSSWRPFGLLDFVLRVLRPCDQRQSDWIVC